MKNYFYLLCFLQMFLHCCAHEQFIETDHDTEWRYDLEPTLALIQQDHSYFKHAIKMAGEGADIETTRSSQKSLLYKAINFNYWFPSIKLLVLYGAKITSVPLYKNDSKPIPADITLLLSHHACLQEDLQNSVRIKDYFPKLINSAYVGLISPAIKKGIKPQLEHLARTKKHYNTFLIETFEQLDHAEVELYLQAFRDIGKKFIQYLRLTTGIGCKTYPAISKKGIQSMGTGLPKELVHHIAWYAIT